MQKAIFSIKPQYAFKIVDGSKKYEFRKRKIVQPIETIIIYATAPVSKIIGEFSINKILVDSPYVIWEQTRESAGIDESEFFAYFNNCKNAVAYEIDEVRTYKQYIDLSDLGVKHAPQSYVYIK